MAELGAIVGESGSGKSTSLRNLDPKTTFIINVAGKNLPMKNFRNLYQPLKQGADKGFYGNIINTNNVDKINQIIQIVDKGMPHIKHLIIDDSQYIMAFEAMDRASDKGYEKFTQMAQHFYSVLKNAMSCRDSLKIFILAHSENIGDALTPSYKIKTLGKSFCP